MPALSVGVILDSAPTQQHHVATLAALEHAADALSVTLDTRVTPSDARDRGAPVESYAAIVVGPGSPYRDPDAVLARIRAARERGVRVALLVRLRLRLLGPLASLIRQPNTNATPRRSNPIDAAYREVDAALDPLSAALRLQHAA